jgi:probable phosphoglycerate mutase
MSKSNEIRVLLVRTGETEWDQAGRITGAADVPLSEAGLEAATKAADELAATGTRLSTVFCGQDEASVATAERVASATGARIKPLEELSEIKLGLWEGLRLAELEEKCPSCVRQWRDDPASVQAPEGETLEDARDRLMEALGKSVGKVRGDSGAVGVVLRPLAHALVGCELSGTPTRNLWSMIESGLSTQWRTVDRNQIREAADRVRAGA